MPVSKIVPWPTGRALIRPPPHGTGVPCITAGNMKASLASIGSTSKVFWQPILLGSTTGCHRESHEGSIQQARDLQMPLYKVCPLLEIWAPGTGKEAGEKLLPALQTCRPRDSLLQKGPCTYRVAMGEKQDQENDKVSSVHTASHSRRKALFILIGTAGTLWLRNCHEGYRVVQTVPVCTDIFLEHANNKRLLCHFAAPAAILSPPAAILPPPQPPFCPPQLPSCPPQPPFCLPPAAILPPSPPTVASLCPVPSHVGMQLDLALYAKFDKMQFASSVDYYMGLWCGACLPFSAERQPVLASPMSFSGHSSVRDACSLLLLHKSGAEGAWLLIWAQTMVNWGLSLVIPVAGAGTLSVPCLEPYQHLGDMRREPPPAANSLSNFTVSAVLPFGFAGAQILCMGSAALSLCVNKNNSSLCPTRLHGDDSCLRQGPGKKGVSRDRDDKDRFMPETFRDLSLVSLKWEPGDSFCDKRFQSHQAGNACFNGEKKQTSQAVLLMLSFRRSESYRAAIANREPRAQPARSRSRLQAGAWHVAALEHTAVDPFNEQLNGDMRTYAKIMKDEIIKKCIEMRADVSHPDQGNA
ncbi:hypothetical protein Anapl_00309 [Anas platyrhynchos]|uniref:Uncharacterized protein n=1 Tax=Anas platyrhynchos TaxID=8839 RepID=R0M1U3_ANAPL|nr:hypothetical protein Anapl_00309 [Anas platyrhynchos]